MLNTSKKLKIYSYKNKKLKIKNEKIEYINIKNEKQIKMDLLDTDRNLYLETYLIISDDIRIKNISYGYSFYKIITDNDLINNIDDILQDQYDFNNLKILVFSYNKEDNLKAIIISNFSDIENYIENYPDRNYHIEYNYFYLMVNNEIRLYYNTPKRKYILVNEIKKLKYKDFLNIIKNK